MDNKSVANQQKELLNVREAASFLGVSATTIRRWAQKRSLTGIKVGIRGDWRFTKEDLLKKVRKNT